MSQTAILVKEKGVVRIDKPFDFMCSQLRNGRYKVTIERYTEPRTISQNALMWLWFTCIEQETGTDKQDVHDYYCNRFSSQDGCNQRKGNGYCRKYVTAEHFTDDGFPE